MTTPRQNTICTQVHGSRAWDFQPKDTASGHNQITPVNVYCLMRTRCIRLGICCTAKSFDVTFRCSPQARSRGSSRRDAELIRRWL